jgi:hypothetical protein
MRHNVVVDKAEAVPDGRIVMSAAGDAVSLWFAADGSPAGPNLIQPSPVQDFYVFSNPLRVVTSDHEKDLWWWDLSVELRGPDSAAHLRKTTGTALGNQGSLVEVRP